MFDGKSLFSICQARRKNCIFISIETVGETFVSSDCWGEDSNYESADAAHFHVASSAFLFLNELSFHISILQS
jgi:hypothetical protein